MFKYVNVLIVIFYFEITFSAYPSDLPRCNYADSKCLSEVITKIVNNQFDGHSELNLIKIDPLHIKYMEINQDPRSPVNIQLKFNDVDLIGIKSANIYKTVGFEKDPNTSSYEMYAKIPMLKFSGQYEVKGNVLILPITGNGSSTFTFDNVDASVILGTKVVMKKNKEYLNVGKVKFNFNTTKMHSNFENLFNGDKVLGDNMNLFLNENWEDILNELKPGIIKVIGAVFQKVIDGPFMKFPYNTLFLE